MRIPSARATNYTVLGGLAVFGVTLRSILDFIGKEYFPDFVYPGPAAIYAVLQKDPSTWASAFGFTCGMSLLAGTLAAFLGVILGVLVGYWRLWSLAKYMQLIWSIPMIAATVYLSLCVGYGWALGLSLALFLGFYPAAKYSFDVCTREHEGILALRAGFSLTKLQEVRHLRLPLLWSGLGTALASTLPLSVLGETMGEYTTGTGLGGLLNRAQSTSRYDKLWCSILLLMIVVFLSGFLLEHVWNRLFSMPNNEEVFN